jgi:hypothetical protein
MYLIHKSACLFFVTSVTGWLLTIAVFGRLPSAGPMMLTSYSLACSTQASLHFLLHSTEYVLLFNKSYATQGKPLIPGSKPVGCWWPVL